MVMILSPLYLSLSLPHYPSPFCSLQLSHSICLSISHSLSLCFFVFQRQSCRRDSRESWEFVGRATSVFTCKWTADLINGKVRTEATEFEVAPSRGINLFGRRGCKAGYFSVAARRKRRFPKRDAPLRVKETSSLWRSCLNYLYCSECRASAADSDRTLNLSKNGNNYRMRIQMTSRDNLERDKITSQLPYNCTNLSSPLGDWVGRGKGEKLAAR